MADQHPTFLVFPLPMLDSPISETSNMLLASPKTLQLLSSPFGNN